MVNASKILTVSYGTFSCTLEGFDDPFSTMKSIAEYFRDLAADDRYFGAEPPTPDAEMLHRIAEREAQRRVEAKVEKNGVYLRQATGKPHFATVGTGDDSRTQPRAAIPAPQERRSPVPPPQPRAENAENVAESVAEKLKRIRAAVARAQFEPQLPSVFAEDEQPEPLTNPNPVPDVPALAEAPQVFAPDAVADVELDQEVEAPEDLAEAEDATVDMPEDAGTEEAEASAHAALFSAMATDAATEEDDADEDELALDGAEQLSVDTSYYEAEPTTTSPEEVAGDLAEDDMGHADVAEDEQADTRMAGVIVEDDTEIALDVVADDTARDLTDPDTVEVHAVEVDESVSGETVAENVVDANADDVVAEDLGKTVAAELETAEGAIAAETTDDTPETIAEDASEDVHTAFAADFATEDGPVEIAEVETAEEDASDAEGIADASEAEADMTWTSQAPGDKAASGLDHEDETTGQVEDSAGDDTLFGDDLATSATDDNVVVSASAEDDAESDTAEAEDESVSSSMQQDGISAEEDTETDDDGLTADDAFAMLTGTYDAEADDEESSSTEEPEELDDAIAALLADRADEAGTALQDAEATGTEQKTDAEQAAGDDAEITVAADGGDEKLPPLPLTADQRVAGADAEEATEDTAEAETPAPMDRDTIRKTLGATGLSTEDEDDLIDELMRAGQQEAGDEAEAQSADAAGTDAEGGMPRFDDVDAEAAELAGPAAPRHRSSETPITRLLAQTDDELRTNESTRRRSAIAHLKAAVAAVRAEGGADEPKRAQEAAKTMNRYREDLASAVGAGDHKEPKPADEAPAGTALPDEGTEAAKTAQEPATKPRRKRWMAPLMLVSEQRVDRVDTFDEDAEPVRPRRIRSEDLDGPGDPAEPKEEKQPEAVETGTGFGQFVEDMAPDGLQELLEASAAFSRSIEGDSANTRPQIMSRVMRHLPEGAFSREEGLRAFGVLLREGRILRVERGRFTVAPTSRFNHSEKRSAAG